MDRLRARIGDKRVLRLVKAFLKGGVVSEDGIERDTITGTPQGGLCSAEHKEPYEQRWVMRSVDPSGLVRAGSGAERCA
jgi:RNA-directed DNA polymerase